MKNVLRNQILCKMDGLEKDPPVHVAVTVEHLEIAVIKIKNSMERFHN